MRVVVTIFFLISVAMAFKIQQEELEEYLAQEDPNPFAEEDQRTGLFDNEDENELGLLDDEKDEPSLLDDEDGNEPSLLDDEEGNEPGLWDDMQNKKVENLEGHAGTEDDTDPGCPCRYSGCKGCYCCLAANI